MKALIVASAWLDPVVSLGAVSCFDICSVGRNLRVVLSRGKDICSKRGPISHCKDAFLVRFQSPTLIPLSHPEHKRSQTAAPPPEWNERIADREPDVIGRNSSQLCVTYCSRLWAETNWICLTHLPQSISGFSLSQFAPGPSLALYLGCESTLNICRVCIRTFFYYFEDCKRKLCCYLLGDIKGETQKCRHRAFLSVLDVGKHFKRKSFSCCILMLG